MYLPICKHVKCILCEKINFFLNEQCFFSLSVLCFISYKNHLPNKNRSVVKYDNQGTEINRQGIITNKGNYNPLSMHI
jgi:hypothetical protein